MTAPRSFRKVAGHVAAAALIGWLAGCQTPGWFERTGADGHRGRVGRASVPAAERGPEVGTEADPTRTLREVGTEADPTRTHGSAAGSGAGNPVVTIYPSFGPARSGQALDPGAITLGGITVSGPDIATPLTATVSLWAGAAASFSVEVPAGPNRVIEVRGLTAAGAPVSPQAVIRAVASVPGDAVLRVNHETTIAADIVLALRTAGSPAERTVDRTALAALASRLIRPAQTAALGQTAPAQAAVPPGAAWEVHPALVDASAIAAEIADGGSVPAARPAFLRQAAWVTGRVSGLLFGQWARVWADDAASLPVDTGADGRYTLGPVVPGTPLTLQVRSAFYEATSSAVAAIAPGATRSIDLALGGNYIDKRLVSNGCLQSDTVARWTQLPIRLLAVRPASSRMESAGFRDEHLQALRDAVAVLEAEFPHALRFETTVAGEDEAGIAQTIRRSDIYVRWYGQLKTGCSLPTVGCVLFYPENGLLSGGCETDPLVRNRALQVRMRLATRHHDDNHPLDQRSVRRVALHELIHAVGLDHSPDPRDVMYASTLSYFAHNVTLSPRDRNTIAFLYSLPANFTRDHAAFDLIPSGQNDGALADP